MKGLYTEKEVEFLKSNYKNLSYSKIGKILGRASKSVSEKARRLKLSKKINKIWDIKEERYLINNYDKIPVIKICDYLNRSYQSVTLKAMFMGLKVKHKYLKSKYDENFFNNWSDNLSYMVGIVLSDGYVSNPKFGCFIRLAMCDKDVVEKIKFVVGYTGNIYKKDPRHENYKILYIMNLYGQKMWNFFIDLGMDHNKSYTAKFPNNVPSEYILHCIRGIFDGDGSISMGRKHYPSARICGTKDIVEFVSKHLNLHCTTHQNTETNFTIQYTGKNAVKFLDCIYKDSTKNTRMDRKYNKYLDVLKLWGSKK